MLPFRFISDRVMTLNPLGHLMDRNHTISTITRTSHINLQLRHFLLRYLFIYMFFFFVFVLWIVSDLDKLLLKLIIQSIKFYSHQLMQFLIQPCISPLSYTKIT